MWAVPCPKVVKYASLYVVRQFLADKWSARKQLAVTGSGRLVLSAQGSCQLPTEDGVPGVGKGPAAL